jgi:hypothetical protein
MAAWRTKTAIFALSILNLNVMCSRSPGDGTKEPVTPESDAVVQLDQVSTADLTAREQQQWSTYVGELLAPCADQPVSIAQCVREKRACDACLPGARFLVRQVHQGKARAQIEQAFHLRFSPDEVKSIELDDSPWEGAADAPITIVEWADFECPFCGAASPQLNKAVKRFAPYVKLVFKNYPLGMHEFAEGAARAAVAAQKQGKFWQMHEWMFSNQQSLDKKNLLRRAKEIGLDEQQFIADSESEATADIVNRDRKQADKLGLRGTPTIYINGRSFDITAFSLFEDLDDWLKTEILLRTGKEVNPPVDVAEDKADKPAQLPAEAPATGAQAGSPSSG